MSRTRTDTLEHLIEDLRRDNPRLVVIFGEMHESMEGRKLFESVARHADVGFFELPNACGNPAGHTTPRSELSTMVKALETQGASKRLIQEAKTIAAPRIAVAVDSHTPEARRAWLASEAIKSMDREGVHPEDPVYQTVQATHVANAEHQSGEAGRRYMLAHEALARVIQDGNDPRDPAVQAIDTAMRQRAMERVRDSNRDMARTTAHYLDTHHAGEAPFLGVMLVGRNHIKNLKKYGLDRTDSDIQQVLSEHGYASVTIELAPQRALEDDEPGDYTIRQTNGSNSGVDYIVDVIDPDGIRAGQELLKVRYGDLATRPSTGRGRSG